MNVITILITDDHVLLRQSLCELFNSDKRFRVIGECGSGEEAVALSKKLKPAVVVMDVNLPGINGFEACEIIVAQNSSIKVLGVSMNAEHMYAGKMLQSGAMGYVTKNSPAPELFEALLSVSNNCKYICRDVKDTLSAAMIETGEEITDKKSLTMRETEIIKLIKKGYTSKKIAAELDLSVRAVESHRARIFKKLHLTNIAALVNYGSHLF